MINIFLFSYVTGLRRIVANYFVRVEFREKRLWHVISIYCHRLLDGYKLPAFILRVVTRVKGIIIEGPRVSPPWKLYVYIRQMLATTIYLLLLIWYWKLSCGRFSVLFVSVHNDSSVGFADNSILLLHVLYTISPTDKSIVYELKYFFSFKNQGLLRSNCNEIFVSIQNNIKYIRACGVCNADTGDGKAGAINWY